MPNQPSPESLDSVLQPFDSCFSRASLANFKLLVIGWILCRRRRWITRVVYASGGLGYRHISAFYRFFTSAPWDPDQLGRRLLNQLIDLLPETVEAMVDDTLCRRSGPRIFGISMHHDGAVYCTALTAQEMAGNLQTGHEYRLPTEAEWEYACRAGTASEFNVGSDLFRADVRFWQSYHSNSICYSAGTFDVGSYSANAFDLNDMHGNVFEWCLDSFASYGAAAVTDPFVTGDSNRVIRGGSWNGDSSSGDSIGSPETFPNKQPPRMATCVGD